MRDRTMSLLSMMALPSKFGSTLEGMQKQEMMEIRQKQVRREIDQLADAIANSQLQPSTIDQDFQHTLAFWAIFVSC